MYAKRAKICIYLVSMKTSLQGERIGTIFPSVDSEYKPNNLLITLLMDSSRNQRTGKIGKLFDSDDSPAKFPDNNGWTPVGILEVRYRDFTSNAEVRHSVFTW